MRMSTSRALIVIGGGELACVVIETAQAQGFDVIGFVDPEPCEQTAKRLGVRRLGSDDDLRMFADTSLVLGIGCVSVDPKREVIVRRVAVSSHRWATVIHPSAHISPTAALAEGVVVLAGAVICSGARIGAHCIVNLGAKVDHDVSVGNFVHIAPQVALGGGSSVGDRAYVGMGAIIRDHTRVAERTVVGMGAVVTKEFDPGAVLVGVPAKPVR
jgi:acetyltransferase EpsM